MKITEVESASGQSILRHVHINLDNLQDWTVWYENTALQYRVTDDCVINQVMINLTPNPHYLKSFLRGEIGIWFMGDDDHEHTYSNDELKAACANLLSDMFNTPVRNLQFDNHDSYETWDGSGSGRRFLSIYLCKHIAGLVLPLLKSQVLKILIALVNRRQSSIDLIQARQWIGMLDELGIKWPELTMIERQLDSRLTSEATAAPPQTLLDAIDSTNDYRSNLIRNIAYRLRRQRPDDKKSYQLLTNMDPQLMRSYWANTLYPRVVKWDFPREYDREYYDMIDDLIKNLAQQPIAESAGNPTRILDTLEFKHGFIMHIPMNVRVQEINIKVDSLTMWLDFGMQIGYFRINIEAIEGGLYHDAAVAYFDPSSKGFLQIRRTLQLVGFSDRAIDDLVPVSSEAYEEIEYEAVEMHDEALSAVIKGLIAGDSRVDGLFRDIPAHVKNGYYEIQGLGIDIIESAKSDPNDSTIKQKLINALFAVLKMDEKTQSGWREGEHSIETLIICLHLKSHGVHWPELDLIIKKIKSVLSKIYH